MNLIAGREHHQRFHTCVKARDWASKYPFKLNWIPFYLFDPLLCTVPPTETRVCAETQILFQTTRRTHFALPKMHSISFWKNLWTAKCYFVPDLTLTGRFTFFGCSNFCSLSSFFELATFLPLFFPKSVQNALPVWTSVSLFQLHHWVILCVLWFLTVVIYNMHYIANSMSSLEN